MSADIELRMTAETAADYFAGRVDIARALRNGEIASDVSNPTTLRVASLIKDLLAPR
jgi:hypothetical protein